MKKKHNHDYITAEDYTIQMAKSTHLDPQEDSPGDSEVDAGAEFKMGLNFSADELESEEIDEEKEVEVADADTVDKEIVAPQKKLDIDSLPDSAKVVFSEQPSPWRDLEHNSDTN